MRSLGSIELSYNKVEWCAMKRHYDGHRIPQNHDICLSSARGDCPPKQLVFISTVGSYVFVGR